MCVLVCVVSERRVVCVCVCERACRVVFVRARAAWCVGVCVCARAARARVVCGCTAVLSVN